MTRIASVKASASARTAGKPRSRTKAPKVGVTPRYTGTDRPPADATPSRDAEKPDPDPAPHPIGRPLTAAQYWVLMERWGVPDAEALDLLGFAGKIGASGTRPRFRFSPLQRRLTTFLAEIDTTLEAAGHDRGWLHKKIRTAPFGGNTPLAFMTREGIDGMAEVLRTLHRAALLSSLRS
jgi:hypothetical protein